MRCGASIVMINSVVTTFVGLCCCAAAHATDAARPLNLTNIKRALLLGGHPDDPTQFAGGLAFRLARQRFCGTPFQIERAALPQLRPRSLISAECSAVH